MMTVARAQMIATGAYIAIAAMTWIGFLRTPPDGLANLFLALIVLPYTLAGLVLTWAMGRSDIVLIPAQLGYFPAHAVFFVPGVALTAALIWWSIGKAFRG